MSDTVQSVLIGRIQKVKRSMIAVTEDLSEAQFTGQPSATAPPIGLAPLALRSLRRFAAGQFAQPSAPE